HYSKGDLPVVSFGLSNLQLRSNLLTDDYQKEMDRVTIFELRDIVGRLGFSRWDDHRDSLAPKQQEELKRSLFWGATGVSMADGDRNRAWLEKLAENVEPVLTSLEDRADVERVFEVLCVAECLAAQRLDSTYAAKADVWRQRARNILGRSEFRLSGHMI